MSRALLLAAVVGAFAINSVDADAETTFLASLDDIPLAPGLTEVKGASLAFEGRDGRILIARAAGAGELAAIKMFYAAALPGLGWARDDGAADMVFLRGRERITIALAPQPDGGVEAAFTLVVAPASNSID